MNSEVKVKWQAVWGGWDCFQMVMFPINCFEGTPTAEKHEIFGSVV